MESKHSNAHSSASPWQSGALTVAGLLTLQPRGLPFESCGAWTSRESYGQRDPSENITAVSADLVALFVKGNGCSWSERGSDLLVLPHTPCTCRVIRACKAKQSKRQKAVVKGGRTTCLLHVLAFRSLVLCRAERATEPLESISNCHSSAFPSPRRPDLRCGNRLSLMG